MRLLLLSSLLAVALGAQAQQGGRPIYPRKEMAYFDSAGTPLPTPLGAGYWLQTIYCDSVSGVLRRYYPSGQLQEYTPYLNLRARVIHGTVTSWYENGRLRTKEEYLWGRRQGQLLAYYPDGTLQRRDTYAAGRSLLGSCFGPTGQPLPYEPYEQVPLYPGGDAWLSREVLRHINLSYTERQHFPYVYVRVEQRGLPTPPALCVGKVGVAFTVAADGAVKDVAITESSMRSTVNEKVLAAVRRLRRFVPGQRNGHRVETRLEMLLSFEVSASFNYSYETHR